MLLYQLSDVLKIRRNDNIRDLSITIIFWVINPLLSKSVSDFFLISSFENSFLEY